METEADSRADIELFRELLRLWPGAVVEEYYYYQTGVWDRECLLIDIELIERHRQEAGSPDPPPLEDIPEIDLTFIPCRHTTKSSQRAPKSSQRLKPTAPSEPLSEAAIAAQRQADEEQELRNFVHGWRLDLPRTKELLSLVRPSRRRWVMQSFAHDGYGDAMEQLELLIEVSEGQVLQPASQTALPSSKRKFSDVSGHSDVEAKRMPPMVGSVAKLAKPTGSVGSVAKLARPKEAAPIPPRMNGSVGLASSAQKPMPRLSGSVALGSNRSPPLVGSIGRQPSQFRSSEEAESRPVAVRGSIGKLLGPSSGAPIAKTGAKKNGNGLISSLLSL